jgi:hypothetical protein
MQEFGIEVCLQCRNSCFCESASPVLNTFFSLEKILVNIYEIKKEEEIKTIVYSADPAPQVGGSPVAFSYKSRALLSENPSNGTWEAPYCRRAYGTTVSLIVVRSGSSMSA